MEIIQLPYLENNKKYNRKFGINHAVGYVIFDNNNYVFSYGGIQMVFKLTFTK